MQIDITPTNQVALRKTGDQVTVQAGGLSLQIVRQDEGISLYTRGASDEALKEDWTPFTEAEAPDPRFEVAAQAAGWSLIAAQDEHNEAFVLQVDGQDDRVEYYGDWEELCLSEGIEVEAMSQEPSLPPCWDICPDLVQADREGWWIAECSDLGTVSSRLERIDSTEIFASDGAAWNHVWGQAQEGSAYHLKVLTWLAANAPLEFKRICDHVADKTTWAIVNGAGDFWSNDDGWGPPETKTLFYAHEKLTMPLPIGGTWSMMSQASEPTRGPLRLTVDLSFGEGLIDGCQVRDGVQAAISRFAAEGALTPDDESHAMLENWSASVAA